MPYPTYPLARLAFTAALAFSAVACSTTTTHTDTPLLTVPQTAVSANVFPPRYKAGTARATIFARLNAYRQACGFPAYAENQTLDAAAEAHAKYMAANAMAVTDVQSLAGVDFTGTTYAARAARFGYPDVGVGGVSNSILTTVDRTDDEYGRALLDGWLSGVYHAWLVASPLTELGLGSLKTQTNGMPKVLANVTVAYLQNLPGNLPLTFPCQGTSGVPYGASGESPAPPDTAGSWGTPIAVSANPNDTVRLTAGSLTSLDGSRLNLELLDSSNDKNHEVEPYSAVAYPTRPLLPDTTYSVTLTGTVNGKAFTREFTFRTGDQMG